uniref:Uncharacterized protein n=1 Tax=Alexandrium monilatum TaxID=311494 RepID=A0A7S4R1R4_9DINO
MATSGGGCSGSPAEGLPEDERGLVCLIDRGLRDVEERLFRHVQESLGQLAQRADAERETLAMALTEVQIELASQHDGSQGLFAELRRDLGAVEEAVYSKCRELSGQLATVHEEQAQSVEQARVVVEGAEGSLRGQLKQFIDQLRGEMVEAAAAGRGTEASPCSSPSLSDDRSAELRALLDEERSLREAEGAAFLARLEALEASSAGVDAAAAEERMAAEAQLTALCARLEAISREVTSRAPTTAPTGAASAASGLGEAEAQALLARLEAEVRALLARQEAVEALCRDSTAGPTAGAFAALRDRFEAMERQVASLAAATPRPASAAATGQREAGAGGMPLTAEKALAAKLSALERDQGVGAATSALSCGLARCIGEFDAELRVELKERIDGLREEFQAEGQTEALLKQLSADMEGSMQARLKQVDLEFEAKLNQAARDTEAKINQAAIDTEAKIRQTKLDIEASADLGQRVAALEGEARRTSYLITRCIGELSGSRICGSDSAGGKDMPRNSAETATTASTPTAVPGSASPASAQTAPPLSSEDLGASGGRSAATAGPHGREGASLQVKQIGDAGAEEGHGWEAPAAPSQRLAAEVPGAGTPGRPTAARGLSASASCHSMGLQASPLPDSPHRRVGVASIGTLPPGSYPGAGSPTPDTPVDTTRGSVSSSDTMPVKQVQARGLYGEARAALDEASQAHGQQEEASGSRRRVVVVPVSTTGRSVSPELRRTGAARAHQRPGPTPVQATLASAASSDVSSSAGGFEAISSEERQRYLAEITSLRRENSSLREEVIDSREQALRQLRSNAERALRQQAGPGGAEAEGPVVAAALTPGVPAPSPALRAGFQRSVSPLPPSSRVQVMPQVTSRTATPAWPVVVAPGSPLPREAMTSRSSASPGPRRPGATVSRMASAGAWEADPATTARISSTGMSPGLEGRQLRPTR